METLRKRDLLESRSEDGDTLLFEAALCGNVSAVAVLLNAGLSAHHVNNEGSTVLHSALSGAFYLKPPDFDPRPVEWLGKQEPAKTQALIKILGLLLDAGADPNGGSDRGHSPLHIAVLAAWNLQSIALVELLLERGAHPDLRAPGWYGVQPLHVALEAPTFITASGLGLTPAPLQTESQYLDVLRALVKTLVSAGHVFETSKHWNRDPSLEMIWKCNPRGRRAILAEGVGLGKALRTGQAACHYAAQWVALMGERRDTIGRARAIESPSVWLKGRLTSGTESVETLREYLIRRRSSREIGGQVGNK